jgi:hypothetical protein
MAFIKFKPLTSSFYFYASASHDEIGDDINKYLVDGEKVMYVFRSQRDLGIFTNKRIVLIDKKGIRGYCRSIYCIDYKSISSYIFTVHDFDSTFEIITNSSHIASINFLKQISLEEVDEVYKYLTGCVIKE